MPCRRSTRMRQTWERASRGAASRSRSRCSVISLTRRVLTLSVTPRRCPRCYCSRLNSTRRCVMAGTTRTFLFGSSTMNASKSMFRFSLCSSPKWRFRYIGVFCSAVTIHRLLGWTIPHLRQLMCWHVRSVCCFVKYCCYREQTIIMLACARRCNLLLLSYFCIMLHNQVSRCCTNIGLIFWSIALHITSVLYLYRITTRNFIQPFKFCLHLSSV